MTVTETYVVGIDGSATSTAALRWAVHHARVTGAAVHAVAVWSYQPGLEPGVVRRTAGDLAGEYRRSLQKLVVSVQAPAVEVTADLLEGDPAEVLLEAADGADLLVLGSHGHGALVSALIGSVGSKCLRHATCPVVIIPARTVAEKASTTVATASYQPGPVF